MSTVHRQSAFYGEKPLVKRTTLLHHLSIAGSHAVGHRADAQFGKHRLIELAQYLCSLGVGTNAKQLLLESQIGRQSPRELKCDRLIEIHMRRLMAYPCQFQHFKV